MNERIKELSERAGFSFKYKTAPDELNPGHKLQDLEKFAELIIQECVEIALEQKKWVEDQVVFNPRDKEWNLARIQQSQRIVDKIKEHFGVEQ